MTVSVRLPDANFTKYAGFAHIPFVDRFDSLMFFGGDATASALNHIPDALHPTATMGGSPTIAAASALFDATTEKFDSLYLGGGNPNTQIFIHQTPSGTLPAIGGHGPAKDLLTFTSGNHYTVKDNATRINGVPLVGIPAGLFAFTAMTWDGTTQTLYRSNGTTNTFSKATAAVSANAYAQQNWQVGTGAGTGTGSVVIASAALANEDCLSEAELLVVLEYFRLVEAARGNLLN